LPKLESTKTNEELEKDVQELANLTQQLMTGQIRQQQQIESTLIMFQELMNVAKINKPFNPVEETK